MYLHTPPQTHISPETFFALFISFLRAFLSPNHFPGFNDIHLLLFLFPFFFVTFTDLLLSDIFLFRPFLSFLDPKTFFPFVPNRSPFPSFRTETPYLSISLRPTKKIELMCDQHQTSISVHLSLRLTAVPVEFCLERESSF